MYIIISLCIVRPLRRLLDEQFGEFGEIENIKVSGDIYIRHYYVPKK